ncbi:sigma-70 family RNA polymerase sigma factor [Sphingomonas canadensis]|uniref:Sigma-70 family RNA polymerase sigma factor n=1 Tax=Sphingomonas canadensis TaxID=1219257 RepID=A0ABW3H4R4_9SPHN|nr:sigma-70 family RNA polymerase sigma factor [Sphingomonas canadensis]MCW3835701.1 sigma-70 family RNA polymerase sigma factor [Sphingomonas canadensis]
MRASEEQLRMLMTAGLAGDAGAHRNLLSLIAPVLRGFFTRRLGELRDDAEDLVQETLIAVHTRRATYDPRRPFTAWMYAIARYKLIDHFRRHRRHANIEDLSAMLVREGFEDEAGARLDIGRLLRGLPAKQARAIADTRIDGLSIAEASGLRSMSESDVKVSVHRGIKALAARVRGK